MTTGQPYPHVFQPLTIGRVEVRNRLYWTPHTVTYALPDPARPGHLVTSERHAFYYAERSRGGIGLIIQEATDVHPTSQTMGHPSADAEHTIPSYKQIADAVHAHGARLFIQLWHGGHHGDPRWEPLGPWAPRLSASTTQAVEGYFFPREMTRDDIRDVIDGFARSTRNVKAAGYDGVEIHAAHSYLPEQFLSPFFNKRTDEYGGSLEGRLRFTLELIEAMRDAAGPDMALGLRMVCDELLPGGLTQDDYREIFRRLDETGKVDFLDLDIGTYHTFPLMIPTMFVPKLPGEEYIANVRSAIRRAAVLGCPGQLSDPADAERLIAEGKMDMVGAARAFMCEPELAKNAQAGRHDLNRPCIACNACLGDHGGGGISCAYNPATGREKHWGVTTFAAVSQPRRVVVVGGGPAGLEAARVAAKRGQQVTLYHRGATLGGSLNLMAELPGREIMSRMSKWFAAQLELLGVTVHVGTEATPEVIEREQPDAVVVATGSHFDRTGETGFIAWPIPGWERDFVYTPEQVIRDGVRTSGNAIVLDEEGAAMGAGVAEMLAERGANVELVTRWPQMVPQLYRNQQFGLVLPRLYAAGVTLSPNTYIKEIGDHRVTVFNVFTNEERVVENVGVVVMVAKKRSDDNLAGQLAGHVAELHVIGEAVTPRRITDAVYEGHRAGRAI
ncbi:MAG: NAD-binding protein [Chloroflexi bacterium]|nr:NAD-binding protein [Chloroflexota bacterium]